MRSVHNQISNFGKILFIFDNVDKQSYEYLKLYLNNLPDEARAIITTRHSNLDNDVDKNYKLELSCFTKEEAIKYIKNSAIKDRIKDDQEVKDLTDYLGKEEILPYDINQTVGSIKGNILGGIRDYLSLVEHPADEERIAILHKLLDQHELAWPVLQYISHLDPDFISIDILKEIFKVDSNYLNNPVDALQSLSSIEVIRRDGIPFLKMHRKTQEEVLKFTGNHPEMSISQQEIQNNLLRVLNELLPYTNSFFIENLQLYKEKLLHIEKLIDKSLQNDYLDANLLLVVTKAAFYLNKTSCLEQTITLCEKVLDMSKVKNELNIEKVILENIHVKTLIQNGQYSQALEIATQKLSEHQEIASDNIELLNSFSNISIAYALLGNYKKALEYRLCSVNMHEQFPGENHTYIANSLDNLGGTYMSLGFSNLGLHYHLKSFAMREKLQQNDIEVGKSMNNIGEGYKAIKHYDEALNYISKALNVFQDKLGQSHTYTANTLSNKGEILAHQGNFDKSLKCHLEALAIRKEIFSSNPSHPHILKSLELTSQVYKTLGDIENAQKFNNEADYARGDSPDEQKVESNIESSDSNLLELNCNHLDLIPVCDRSDEKIISALKLDLGNFFQLESNIIPSTQEVEVNTPDTCKTLGDNDDTTCNDLL